MRYEPVIGMEVHLELCTESKMFCSCSAEHFDVEPNTHTCPVCLGLPGALPVPNKRALEWCILIGLAFNCEVARESKFDRKHYFYPDLPKGFQISQYDTPLCSGGHFVISDSKRVGINRVHMEEDTGKLIHRKVGDKEYTLVDFNRSGVPLVEIVSEPDLRSPGQAVLYLKKLQQIVRYLGVSDCDMEKGSMRCEANLSLRRKGEDRIPEYKVEVKNLNSFKFVKKALEYEIERQKKIFDSEKVPVQETRGFDSDKEVTFSQRTKEMAHDYRYFPEPDIPPMRWTREEVERLGEQVPELPDQKKKRLVREYGIKERSARILTGERSLARYFEQGAKLARDEEIGAQKLANVIVNKRVDLEEFSPEELVKHLADQKESRITDKRELEQVVRKVIEENREAVEDYKKGKERALGFLMGRVMKETGGKAEGETAKALLSQELEKIDV